MIQYIADRNHYTKVLVLCEKVKHVNALISEKYVSLHQKKQIYGAII